MDWRPSTGAQVLNKEFIATCTEDQQAGPGRATVLSECGVLVGQAALGCDRSVADWDVICALKMEVL